MSNLHFAEFLAVDIVVLGGLLALDLRLRRSLWVRVKELEQLLREHPLSRRWNGTD
jgi:hypothetical protein